MSRFPDSRDGHVTRIRADAIQVRSGGPPLEMCNDIVTMWSWTSGRGQDA